MTSEAQKPSMTKTDFHIPRMAFRNFYGSCNGSHGACLHSSPSDHVPNSSAEIAPTAEWPHCGQFRKKTEATSSSSEVCIAVNLVNVLVARKSLPSAAPSRWNGALSTGYPQTMKKTRTEA